MREIERLLIANRGEIAARIARTARELDVETVAVYAASDERLAQRYGCSERVPLPADGAAAYLDIEALTRIARETGCHALHPGYGFLSESAALSRACENAGLRFIGPSPATLELFGDKARARELARGEGVPIVPGCAEVSDAPALRRFLDDQPPGTPILLKAIAGGGGRGMRRIERDDEIDEAFARCASEAERAFGSGRLYAERLVEQARHVEVQIVADRSGAIGHLWERDCTVQRRHQKLIEVAPAPDLDPGLRDRLVEDARTLAKAGGLVGLATFEFLIDAAGQPYFIEANPRLQVEHTITEAITGIDLVAAQLGLAAGRSLDELGLATPPAPRGHAIQLRILAESLDEEGRVRPAGEPITRFEPAGGPGIRVDTAVGVGLAAHPGFDPLLAKLVVACPDGDFPRTIRRARRALEEFCIEGPETNLDLLSSTLERPEFERYALTTRFFEDEADALVSAARARASARQDRAEAAPAETPSLGDDVQRRLSSLPEDAVIVTSPLIGTVIECSAEEGDLVAAAAPLFVLESMKMEHVVTAARAGRLLERFAAVGDVVAEGAPLAAMRPSDVHDGPAEIEASLDLDRIRPDLAEVRARHALLEDEARPEAVQRRRSRGQRTARENLADLCDPDSFNEYGALAVAAMRKNRSIDELQRKTPTDAIITGFGAVNGALFDAERARCAVLVVDATVLAGTQGYFHHHKIDRILELAEKAGAPVVFFPEGGGGRPNDTDSADIMVAGLHVTSFHAFARLSGRVPRVAIVSGFCFAGSAAFAGCADVIIATRNTSLGMGGPAMIEGGGLGVHAPEDVGPVDVQEPNGVIDVLVEDEAAAVRVARQYLSYFQGPIDEFDSADPRTLRHLIPENRRRIYDVRRVIEALCDTDSVLELRRAWGVGMITALVRIEGRPMGLVANDPTHLGGAIDDEGAEKAARFLQLCDAFGLPVLSLCDTPGFMVGPEIEARAQVRKVSRLFVVGANLGVPVFCVILRKGYGLGAQAMAGGSFKAPFDIVAWPTGEIGGMGLEGAVRLGFQKQLAAITDEAEQQALFEKLVGVLYEKGKALNAASQLEFDGVIDPAETRARIVRGLKAHGPIGRGSGRFVDAW